MNFINRVVMENNNLEIHKLANPYYVINVDNTPNKVGQITEYVQAYVEIGSHKTYYDLAKWLSQYLYFFFFSFLFF